MKRARAPGALALGVAALATVASCTPSTRTPAWAIVHEVTPQYLGNAAAFEPGLAAGPGGRVALTYVTRDTAGADLWIAFSADTGAHFGPSVRLNQRRGRVASFAESRPVAAFGPAGQLVVAWAAARDSGPPADDVVARSSADGGATFGSEILLNDDRGVPASGYHGFVTLDFTPPGRVIVAWIDGRANANAPGEEEPSVAEIWSTASDDGGRSWRPNVRVAAGVCPCCRPALRTTPSGGVAVAYRGVRDSLRDPRLAASLDGGATFTVDTLVSADAWKLAGCPTTGPAITSGRDGGFYAWFTGAERGAADDGPGVYVAPWRFPAGPVGPKYLLADSIRDGSDPVLASMGSETLVGLLARAEGARRVVAVRLLSPDGPRSPWLLLGANARAAALVATDARHALAAWLEQTGAGPRMRLARLTRR